MNRIGALTGVVLGSAGGLAVVLGASGVSVAGLALLWFYRPLPPTNPEIGPTRLHEAIALARSTLTPCLAEVPVAERGNNQVVLRVDVMGERVTSAWVERTTIADPRAASCLAEQIGLLTIPGCPDMAFRLPFDLP